MFTERELAFIQSQRLLRLATVAADGQPDGNQFIIDSHQSVGRVFLFLVRAATPGQKAESLQGIDPHAC